MRNVRAISMVALLAVGGCGQETSPEALKQDNVSAPIATGDGAAVAPSGESNTASERNRLIRKGNYAQECNRLLLARSGRYLVDSLKLQLTTTGPPSEESLKRHERGTTLLDMSRVYGGVALSHYNKAGMDDSMVRQEWKRLDIRLSNDYPTIHGNRRDHPLSGISVEEIVFIDQKIGECAGLLANDRETMTIVYGNESYLISKFSSWISEESDS